MLTLERYAAWTHVLVLFITASTTPVNIFNMMLFLELMDDDFFVMFSREEELTSDEQFQLGIILKIDELLINKIISDNKEGSSTATFKLLKA